MLHTTFRKAKEARVCVESYRKMAKAVGGVRKYGMDTPIPLSKVLEVCGLDDALWALHITSENSDRIARVFACDCAERVLPLFEKRYPNDKRPRHAIKTARLFAEGKASKSELANAASDAYDAAWRAWATSDAWGVSDAARAASDAARDVSDAARAVSDAEKRWQTEHFLECINSRLQ